MARIIYVVMGTTGEYSDRDEWPVCYFRSKTDAESMVTLAESRANEIELCKGDNRHTRYDKDKHGTNQYDPHMAMDYTGTDYYVMKVSIGRLPKTQG